VERQHSPEYRIVAVFGCLADAEVVRGVLEADGIAAAVFEGTDAALLPGADRAVRVLVPSDDLGRARELIATPVEADDAPDDLLAPPAAALERSWTVLWLALLGATAIAIAAAVL
jgi:hypothetical protein